MTRRTQFITSAQGANAMVWFFIYQGAKKPPLLTLGLDTTKSGVRMRFNRDGMHLMRGNINGTVFVADLEAVRKQLASVEMGWCRETRDLPQCILPL